MANKKDQINEEVENQEVEGLEEIDATEHFVENNAKQIGIAIAAVLALIVGGILYYNSSSSSVEEDQKNIFRAQYYYSIDSLNLALFGDDSGSVNPDLIGFDELTTTLSSSEVKNLNNFYVGVINLQNGEYQQAIDYLTDFSTDDGLLQAKANEQIGNAYMELAEVDAANYDNAIKYYDKAASLEVNSAFTPGYLLKLALAYELKGDKQAAIETYNKIVSGFNSSVPEVAQAKKYKTVLEVKKQS